MQISKLRIIYCWIGGSLERVPGVKNKIVAQIKAFQKNNIDSFGLTVVPEECTDTIDGCILIKKDLTASCDFKIISTYLEKLPLLPSDYIFLRYPLHQMIGFLDFAKRFGSHLILEHNTKEIKELKYDIWRHVMKHRSIFKSVKDQQLALLIKCLYYELCFKSRIRREALMGVCVTREIADYQKQILGQYCTVVIGNGFLKEEAVRPLRTVKNFSEGIRYIMIIGHKSTINGVDRFLKGLLNYQGDDRIQLDIYGPIELYDEQLLRKLGNIPRICVCHYKLRDEGEIDFSSYHCGLGSFGFHRKGLQEATPLKSRTYFKSGLPVVGSYIDSDLTDIPNHNTFYKMEAADDSALDISAINTFVKSFWAHSIYSQTLYTVCLSHISYESKAAKLIDSITV